MSNDRLTSLDTTFLHIEDRSPAHMHVAGIMLFEGPAPRYADLLEATERRLHLVPRYRQRLVFTPFGLSNPCWVDDPYFNLEFHVRATALPAPAGERELKDLAGRLLSQRLDRDRPLWELWLVERVEPGMCALISKTHHCLVDGVSGVDVASVLFDAERTPADAGRRPRPWLARPLPSTARTLASAIGDQLMTPIATARTTLATVSRPEGLVETLRTAASGAAAVTAAQLRPVPPSIYNCPIGPHRRFTWVRSSVATFKAIKNALGGSLNDAVLASVTGALRNHMERRGEPAEGVELLAMVPVSTRTSEQRGALGNRVSTFFAPLPVGVDDAVERMRIVSESMRTLKEGGQAVGASMLTSLSDLAPPTILSQATRLMVGSRMFNLTVTNVPGPQLPLYSMGRELQGIIPMVPLAPQNALGIAIMSYNGHLDFGLVGDFDAMSDIDDLAVDLRASIDELTEAARRAGGDVPARPGRRARASGRPSRARDRDAAASPNGRGRRRREPAPARSAELTGSRAAATEGAVSRAGARRGSRRPAPAG